MLALIVWKFSNFFWQFFSWNQSCQQLKSSKPQHFHEFFTPNNSTIFLGKSKLNFWTKNEDFEQCVFLRHDFRIAKIFTKNNLDKKITWHSKNVKEVVSHQKFHFSSLFGPLTFLVSYLISPQAVFIVACKTIDHNRYGKGKDKNSSKRAQTTWNLKFKRKISFQFWR